MEINKSGIHPAGWRVLVSPKEIAEKSSGGIILGTESGRDRENMASTTGVVVAVGDECYKDTKSVWCKVGDKISFAKYAGLLYKGKDGLPYRMINDEDVTGLLDDDVDLIDPYLSKGLT
ncbi:GroS Co-chaperonin GroES (HSP10) [uncultured Caudovirales phage]|uniref:GroS Co-chaperonin GroES (HSP10) n=1 Tax=uncultured Caudovirales phage TaxID=2100421 RepID=A0A6J5SNZ7_9CAUD|nr:GroS Co-chaperonin GroES (HSP10) [uncultured Caudovirales phage]